MDSLNRPASRSGALVGGTVRSLLRRPTDALDQVRWVFLLFAAFFATSIVVRTVLSVGRPLALRILLVVLLAVLLCLWIRGFRRSAFPRLCVPLEAATIAVAAVCTDPPVSAVGLVYGAVAFRASYGSPRRAGAYIACSLGAFTAGLLVATAMQVDVDYAFALAPMSGVPVMGLLAHLIATASERVQNAAVRERVVSRSGLALALAEDADSIRAAGLAAVAALTADTDGARAHVVTTSLPPESGGARLVLPLRTANGPQGHFVIDSPAALPDEVRDALGSVSTQVALALAAAALTTDLRVRASTDPLTGLANRACVDHALAEAVAGPELRSAVLLLDLDGFKQVNDELGHAAGDLLLVEVAARLRAAVRADDLVGRLGGDEFVVLLRHQGSEEHARLMAHRIELEIARPVTVGPREVTVGVSVGIAVGRPGQSADDLLRDADAAMYRRKQQRKRALAAI